MTLYDTLDYDMDSLIESTMDRQRMLEILTEDFAFGMRNEKPHVYDNAMARHIAWLETCSNDILAGFITDTLVGV